MCALAACGELCGESLVSISSRLSILSLMCNTEHRPHPPCPGPRLPACVQVVKHTGLLSSSSTSFLQQKLQLRAPYVAPLNILQVGHLVVLCTGLHSCFVLPPLACCPACV